MAERRCSHDLPVGPDRPDAAEADWHERTSRCPRRPTAHDLSRHVIELVGTSLAAAACAIALTEA
jgi:hypothetical protein